ncbi:hypothetical protein GUITHDRAFT_103725 [Guillardia theta CCMP2712]|uniref:Uncharacterized protein n=2 Tax=Guillardia theta TaxID=55529 RepID=L1JQC9_GUITC|nr:hypothetical protein GUITHDRAFT_103725 [Guillardia theta CCMP2712]EKX50494.1 hypothetical protein GUITHDRAFT_103725 [Guillardia theta CCMP2712]|eukprot:XP_005837474.1 hypothetical protein GUITHDRAFT_103725 [Guillardia theta CCMP2712]
MVDVLKETPDQQLHQLRNLFYAGDKLPSVQALQHQEIMMKLENETKFDMGSNSLFLPFQHSRNSAFNVVPKKKENDGNSPYEFESCCSEKRPRLSGISHLGTVAAALLGEAPSHEVDAVLNPIYTAIARPVQINCAPSKVPATQTAKPVKQRRPRNKKAQMGKASTDNSYPFVQMPLSLQFSENKDFLKPMSFQQQASQFPSKPLQSKPQQLNVPTSMPLSEGKSYISFGNFHIVQPAKSNRVNSEMKSKDAPKQDINFSGFAIPQSVAIRQEPLHHPASSASSAVVNNKADDEEDSIFSAGMSIPVWASLTGEPDKFSVKAIDSLIGLAKPCPPTAFEVPEFKEKVNNSLDNFQPVRPCEYHPASEASGSPSSSSILSSRAVEADIALEGLAKETLGIHVKPNARNRMKDLMHLLIQLESKNVLKLVKSKDDGGNCILGFSEIQVHELQVFNMEIRRMVLEDENRCWLVNGKTNIKEPTGPVYEILRQIGIKPMRGMRGPRKTDPGKRDFMYSYRYIFDVELMMKNRNRLQSGYIGRSHRPDFELSPDD